MIANLYAEETAASRMLDMIARCAPRLMRCGGGALQGEEQHGREHSKHTPEQIARIVALGREQRLSATDIARECGSTQSATQKILEKHGIRAPDGRGFPRASRKKTKDTNDTKDTITP